MRAPRRFRWLVPAFGIPICIAAAGVGIQAAALRRPARESLVAAAAVRELLRYRVMRGTQRVAGRRLNSVCIDGWFRGRRRRLVRGSLVLLSNGERLYDVGYGIHRAGHPGPATPVDRAHFVLAGCPRYLGESVSARLMRAESIDADPTRPRAKRATTLAIVFGRPTQPVSFFVALPTYLSVGVQLEGSQVRGESRLLPGGGPAQILRVEHAFGVGRGRTIHA